MRIETLALAWRGARSGGSWLRGGRTVSQLEAWGSYSWHRRRSCDGEVCKLRMLNGGCCDGLGSWSPNQGACRVVDRARARGEYEHRDRPREECTRRESESEKDRRKSGDWRSLCSVFCSYLTDGVCISRNQRGLVINLWRGTCPTDVSQRYHARGWGTFWRWEWHCLPSNGNREGPTTTSNITL